MKRVVYDCCGISVCGYGGLAILGEVLSVSYGAFMAIFILVLSELRWCFYGIQGRGMGVVHP